MFELTGKKIFITGGGRGIGAGIARVLADAGARVALSYTSRPDDAEKTLGTLKGQGHFTVKMDISSAESVDQAFAQVLEKFGGLDGVVNNAGITRDQLILRMKPEDFDAVVQTNLGGTFLCTKLAIKAMLKARAGSIVNISSVIGQMGNPGQSNYAASKAGIEGFSRATALEVASRNIRVNCVAPGFITTEMTDALDDKQRESIQNRIPLGRLGTVEDVANTVAFLLSDQTTYVTGQVIQVNGGLYM
jgi:3-oxoacyl-[acyl-carrier protein] reductase